MEYVEGVSLAQAIEEQHPLDPSDVAHWWLEMLGILEYLHGRVPSILHRDIKPSNIIIQPDGRPTLVDFGTSSTWVRRVRPAISMLWPRRSCTCSRDDRHAIS